jgi:hypothetical protein
MVMGPKRGLKPRSTVLAKTLNASSSVIIPIVQIIQLFHYITF